MFRIKVVEEIKTHFMFSNFFFFENSALLIMWINIVEPDWPQMTVWRMGIACWITKATNTNPECNTYCFSTTTVVTRTRFGVTLCVNR